MLYVKWKRWVTTRGNVCSVFRNDILFNGCMQKVTLFETPSPNSRLRRFWYSIFRKYVKRTTKLAVGVMYAYLSAKISISKVLLQIVFPGLCRLYSVFRQISIVDFDRKESCYTSNERHRWPQESNVSAVFCLRRIVQRLWGIRRLNCDYHSETSTLSFSNLAFCLNLKSQRYHWPVGVNACLVFRWDD